MIHPVALIELFNQEVHALLKDSAPSNDWYAFTEHDELSAEAVCEVDVCSC